MIEIRKAEDRGHANHGWLDSHHTFSFADYYDAAEMGWGALRVINDDTVEPGKGFATHGHRDMEIITYVLEGALEHRDSMGSGSVIRPGDVQVMSAGTGVQHSEFNHSKEEAVHLLQIWVLPKFRGVRPGYQEKRFDLAGKRGALQRIVSPDGSDGSLRIVQDASIHAGLVDGDETVRHRLEGSKGYVHVARGSLRVNGLAVAAGDGVKLAEEAELVLSDGEQAEVLVFDLP